MDRTKERLKHPHDKDKPAHATARMCARTLALEEGTQESE
jgi:hypothetical protein